MLRKYLSRISLTRQMTAVISIAIIILAIVTSLITSFVAGSIMRDYILQQGKRVTEAFAEQSVLGVLYGTDENISVAVKSALDYQDVVQIVALETGGRVVISVGQNGALEPSTRVVPANVAHASAILDVETEHEWRFGAPVFSGDKSESPFEVTNRTPKLVGYVYVTVSKRTHEKLLLAIVVWNLAISLTLALIALLVAHRLARQVTRPLHALSSLMHRAELSETGLRAQPDGPTDIVNMSHAFNKMMTVIEDREAELKRSRDAAIRSAMVKAQFAATVSHEVRTPLNGIVGMLDMLRETRLTKDQQDYLDVAWKSSRALVDLLNDVLDFSKIEAGKMELDQAEIDPYRLIDEVFDLFTRQAQQKGLRLAYVVAPTVPDRFLGDPLRLRQVLINLVGNAIKFTNHGQISLLVEQRGIDENALDLWFEITDTGIGMTPEESSRIFDSYEQASESTQRNFGGTGLGLTICRQLVELMGGKIDVSSVAGVGSTFRFNIQCSPCAAIPFVPEGEYLDGVRVIVVDESDVIREFAANALTRQGMVVNSFAVGTDVLDELKRAKEAGHPYRLVIADVSATDDHGASVIDLIGADRSLSVKVIALDLAAPPYSVSEFRSGITLGKPLRLDRLLEALRRLLGPDSVEVTDVQAKAFSGVIGAKNHRALIVEDNVVNRRVAAGMLAIYGCETDFAENGREAVEKVRRATYDIILMDCNMPEMDGYEATAHIRNWESGGDRHTPIIAMTANSQRGDQEKCIAAGMDDYLSKPITLIEIRRVLNRWILGGDTLQMVQQSLLPEVDTPGIDTEPLDLSIVDKLRVVLGDTLKQTIALYMEDTPAYIDRLEEALSRRDVHELIAAAHRIKGSSGNIGAMHLAHYAREAEAYAETADLDAIKPLLPRIRDAFDTVEAMLRTELRNVNATAARVAEPLPLILVVDDDRSTRSSLRSTLQRFGFQVEEACDGEEGLKQAEALLPELVLMDAVMPNMDGFTACARMQENPILREIPVVIVTALEDSLAVERAFAAGASDYIPKPVHLAVLSQRLRRIVDANRADSRIRQLAKKDSLTGLPNRALFFQDFGFTLERARRDGEMTAVLALDLDRFKHVNDNFGHDVGDMLLKQVSQRLRRTVRDAAVVARIGGDEFAVVIADISEPSSAAVSAQEICKAISTPFRVNDQDIFITASVGIALSPSNGADVSGLLKFAETAMHRAKKASSGFQFFEAAMEQSFAGQVRLENELRNAIEACDLDVYYQPQADFQNGEIVGMEALARWRHPTRGMVPPAEFIPIAEEAGLIGALGDLVLRQACAQMARWKKAGYPELRLSVNVSPKQLMQKDFVATVLAALDNYGIDPSNFELEITESTLMERADENSRMLEQLRANGIRIAIDDFGTGYSSLSYLSRFPIDSIKIDRSFVRDLPQNTDDCAIATSIIELAHSLRLEVIAEGVETVEQHSFLREKGCDTVQGYYLGMPMGAEDFESTIFTSRKSVGEVEFNG